jgi:hypothetical protein
MKPEASTLMRILIGAAVGFSKCVSEPVVMAKLEDPVKLACAVRPDIESPPEVKTPQSASFAPGGTQYVGEAAEPIW